MGSEAKPHSAAWLMKDLITLAAPHREAPPLSKDEKPASPTGRTSKDGSSLVLSGGSQPPNGVAQHVETSSKASPGERSHTGALAPVRTATIKLKVLQAETAKLSKSPSAAGNDDPIGDVAAVRAQKETHRSKEVVVASLHAETFANAAPHGNTITGSSMGPGANYREGAEARVQTPAAASGDGEGDEGQHYLQVDCGASKHKNRPGMSTDAMPSISPSRRRHDSVSMLKAAGWGPDPVSAEHGQKVEPRQSASGPPQRVREYASEEYSGGGPQAGSDRGGGSPSSITAVAAGLRVLRNMQRGGGSLLEEQRPGGESPSRGGDMLQSKRDAPAGKTSSERQSPQLQGQSSKADRRRTHAAALPAEDVRLMSDMAGGQTRSVRRATERAGHALPASSTAQLMSPRSSPALTSTPLNLNQAETDLPSRFPRPLCSPSDSTRAGQHPAKQGERPAAKISELVQRSGGSFSVWAQSPRQPSFTQAASQPDPLRCGASQHSQERSRGSSEGASAMGERGGRGISSEAELEADTVLQAVPIFEMAEFHLPRVRVSRKELAREVKEDNPDGPPTENVTQKARGNGSRVPRKTDSFNFHMGGNGPIASNSLDIGVEISRGPGVFRVKHQIQPSESDAYGQLLESSDLAPGSPDVDDRYRGESGESHRGHHTSSNLPGSKTGVLKFQGRPERASVDSQDERGGSRVRFSLDSQESEGDYLAGGRVPTTPQTARLLDRYKNGPAVRNVAMQTEDFAKSLYILEATNPFRVLCRRIVEHRLFLRVMLICILGSCVDMATYNPMQSENSARNRLVRKVDIAFVVVFFFEMALKIVSYGFVFTDTAYLRSPLNVLDFILTWASLVVLLPTGGRALPLDFLRVLRVVRVLRPLRTVSASPTMRVLVGTVLSSLPNLGNVLLLLFLFLTFFGIMGVQLFGGSLDRQCVNALGAFTDGRRCSAHNKLWAYTCPLGTTCEHTQDWPSQNLTSFANLPRAAIVLFEAITLEGWSDNMYATIEAEGFWAVFYWITVVVFGAFAIMNLALAVVYDNFKKRKLEEQIKAENMRRMRIELRALNSTARQPRGNPLWQPIHWLKDTLFYWLKKVRDSRLSCFRKPKAENPPPKPALESAESVTSAADISRASTMRRWSEDFAPGTPRKNSRHRSTDESEVSTTETEPMPSESDWNERLQYKLALLRRTWRKKQKVMRRTLETLRVDVGFILVVVFNLFVLALRYQGAPRELLQAIDAIDLACTIIFLIETVLKMVAYGPLRFCKDPFNCFDAIIFVITTVNFGTGDRSLHNVASMRTFRVLRVFQLAGKWPSFAIFLSSVFSAMRAVRPFALLLLLFILVSALLGMQVFAGKLNFPDDKPRSNYDNFYWACLTTFQVVAGYNWNDVLASTIRGIGWWAAPYVIFVHVAGGTILLNLLLAILIDSFEENTEREKQFRGELRVRVLEKHARGLPASPGLALKQTVANLRAQAQATSPQPGSGEGDAPANPKPLKASELGCAPRAILRLIGRQGTSRDANARKEAAFLKSKSRAAKVKKAISDKAPRFPPFPLPLELQGVVVDPDVLEWIGTTPPHTGANASFSTPALSPAGSGHFEDSDVPPSGKKRPRKDDELKRALVAGMPQLAGALQEGHERRKSRLTESREGMTSSKDAALAACAVLGFDPTKPMDLNSSFRPGSREKRGVAPKKADGVGDLGASSDVVAARASPRTASALRMTRSVSELPPLAEDCPETSPRSPGDPHADLFPQPESLADNPSTNAPRGLRGKRRTARVGLSDDTLSFRPQGAPPQAGVVSSTEILPVPNLPRLHMPRPGPGKRSSVLRLTRSASSPHIVLRPAAGTRRYTRRVSITALMKPRVQWKELRNLIHQRPLKEPSRGRHLSLIVDPSALHLEPIKKDSAGRVSIPAADDKGQLRKTPSKAFFLLGDKHPLRIIAKKLVANPWFGRGLTLLVIVSTVLLTGDRPALEKGSKEWDGLFAADVLVAGLFVIEALIKMTALGALLDQGAYLRDPWNILDALCTLTTVISVVVENRWPLLHVFRVFRAMRLAQASQGLRMVTAALLGAFRASMSVVMTGAVIFLVFATLGVQIFSGTFSTCSDPTIQLRADCLGVDASNNTREWVNVVPYTFDNLGASALTLFELSTTENADYLMYPGIDSVSVDHSPVLNHRPYASLFYVAFIAVGSLFLINIFVGIVIESFGNDRKDKEIEHLAAMQQQWVETHRAIEMMRPHAALRLPAKRRLANRPSKNLLNPDKPTEKRREDTEPIFTWANLRLLCFDSVTHPYFDRAFAAAIAVNLVILATQEVPAGPRAATVALYSGWVFAGVFTLEVAARLLGLGFRQFFQHRWNIFDLVIMVMTIIGEAMGDRPGAPLVRCFRVIRILKLAREYDGLNRLLKSLLSALPNLWSVATLLILQLYIFAIFGVALFGHMPLDDSMGALSPLINFTTFPFSLLVMFKMLTGENWNFIMHACMDATWLAVPFFVTFVVLGQFVLLNLVIAIIIEAFSEVEDGGSRVINTLVLKKFDAEWTKLDPHATGWISTDQLYRLLTDLGEPLGVKRDGLKGLRASPSAIQPLASQLEMPVFGRGLPYDLVLHCLVIVAYIHVHRGSNPIDIDWCQKHADRRRKRLISSRERAPTRMLLHALPKRMQVREKNRRKTTSTGPAKVVETLCVKEWMAAMTIQAHARRFVARAKLARLRQEKVLEMEVLTPTNSPMLRTEADLTYGAFGNAPRSPRGGILQNARTAPSKQLGAAAFLQSTKSSIVRGAPARAQSEPPGALLTSLRTSAELDRGARPPRALTRGNSDTAEMVETRSGRSVQFAGRETEERSEGTGASLEQGREGPKGSLETLDSVWQRLNHSVSAAEPRFGQPRSTSNRGKRMTFEEPLDEEADNSGEPIFMFERTEGFFFDGDKQS